MSENDIAMLEAYYKQFVQNLSNMLPEDILIVDLDLLKQLDLLNFEDVGTKKNNLGGARFFRVIETDEKVTLHNDQFVVWIIPEKIDQMPVTYTLIAVRNEHSMHLALAFIASGVYNNSKMVLRVLEKLLEEIKENESMIHDLIKKQR